LRLLRIRRCLHRCQEGLFYEESSFVLG
jgi:hypothetical protein